MGQLLGFVLLGLLLIVKTANGTDLLDDKNKKDIDLHETILKDGVMKDLQTLKKKFTDLVTHVNEKLTLLRSYTTKSIEQLKNDARTNMEQRDTTLKNNIAELEKHIRTKIADLNGKMVANLNALNEASSKQRSWIRDWNDVRSKQHENILGTHVSLCAYDHAHFAKQTVTYDSSDGGFLDQHKSWKVMNGPENNDEMKAMEVLNRDTGLFRIPNGAAGLYLFTFSVTMDTADLSTEPAQYEFEKNGSPIPGTRMYSDAGVRHPIRGQKAIYDKVPGSNTILLKLEEGDEVSVKQMEDTDIPDYHVSFCGTLIHLEKASESPGTLIASSSHLDFPKATEAPVVTIEDTAATLTDLGNITDTTVPRVDTKLTDFLDNTTLTANDPNNWRGSTWDENFHN